MGNNKSTPIIIIGIVIFVIGGGALLLVLGNSKSSKKNATPPAITGTTTTTLAGSAVFSVNSTGTTVPPFVIPPGDNALALDMDYYGGVGGYVHAGNEINIFAVVGKDCSAPGANAAAQQNAGLPLIVKLIQSNVKVLEVMDSAPAASGSSGTFLLAATPAQAEQLIFYSHGYSLYFTLTTGTEPAATTGGVTCTNAS